MKLISLAKTWWLKFAHTASYVNTRVILTLFYVLLGFPALFLKIIRKDTLDRTIGQDKSFWKVKPDNPQTLEQSKHQF